MPKALESYGCTFAVSSGSPTSFSAVANISAIRGPGEAAGVIDVSNLDSQAVEKLMMVPDEGQVALDIYYDPSNAIHALLSAARRARTRMEFRISLSDSDPTQMTFFGFVTAFMLNTATSQAVRAAVMIDVDGGAMDRQTSDLAAVYNTFDPANKNASVALSNGNLTATNSTVNGYRTVNGTPMRSDGKRYCEYTIGGEGGTSIVVGLNPTTGSLANGDFIGWTSPGIPNGPGWGFMGDGRTWHGGTTYGGPIKTQASLLLAVITGDVLGLAWDSVAQTIRFWRNNVEYFNTYPALAMVGVTAGAYAPAATVRKQAGGTVITLNAGQSAWIYSPPAGYTGWF